MDLCETDACTLIRMLDRREVSCVEIVGSVLERIGRTEESIGAYLTLKDPETLLAEAGAVDDRRSRGETIGALGGLPIAIKDNICTQGMRTTCASKMLEDFVPPYAATVMHKVRQADGLVIGKTNMDEFAMGSSTENSALKLTRNPHNLDLVPGGSSGGSAAAIAAGQAILSLGSDTGGSIRQPASYCGVVGLKPSYGRVSRYGLVAYASSLDQIGPITRSVADAALLLNVISGHDPLDSTNVNTPVPDYTAALNEPKTSLRIGIPREYVGEGLSDEVRSAVEDAIKRMQALGYQTVDISLPHTEYAISAYYVVASAEASSNLARYDGCHYGYRSTTGKSLMEMVLATRTEGFGSEVKRRIMLGTYALSSGYYDAYYNRALKVRRLISQDFAKAFEQCDVIMSPVAPTSAFPIGSKIDDPLQMYLADVFTVTTNMAGLPAISVPSRYAGLTNPVGIQFIAPYLHEQPLLAVANHFQTAAS